MTQNPTFEQSIKRLEEIVKLLESGEKSLEDSLELFEEGTKLAGICGKKISTAEQKIIKLTEVKNADSEE